jgi:hypothetical protein
VFFIAASPMSLAAQDSPRLRAAATGASVNATSNLSNGTAQLDGVLLGGEGMIAWRRITLRAGYAQGSLGFGDSRPGSTTGASTRDGIVGRMLAGILRPSPSTPSLSDLDLAEGFLTLGWNPLFGLEVGGGAQIRARIADEESERLLLAVVRARYEAPLVAERVRGFVEGWSSVAGRASNPDDDGRGFGGGAGMIVELGPLAIRVSYSVDEARYQTSPRRETFESLAIALGIGMHD